MTRGHWSWCSIPTRILLAIARVFSICWAYFVFQIAAPSRKQAAASHSTPKAEILAAEASVRKVMFPVMDFWEPCWTVA